MTTSKPTLLFIPGAWFKSSLYDRFLSLLRESSYPTICGSYPSLGPVDPNTATALADRDFILEQHLLPLLEEGKDVIVLMHSYGGIPGGAAARDLGKVQIPHDGRRGAVLGLIYIAGFVLPHGASLADAQGGQLPGWVKQNEPSPGLTLPDNPMTILMADLDPVIAKEVVSQVIPHALLAFKSPAPPPAWTDGRFQGRLAFLICAEDQAVPKFGQEAMIQGTGMDWTVREITGSHTSPFLKKEQEAVRMVEEFAEAFLKLDQAELTHEPIFP